MALLYCWSLRMAAEKFSVAVSCANETDETIAKSNVAEIFLRRLETVSYTHLSLPTKRIV